MVVETSLNLTNWVRLFSGTATNGNLLLLDSNASNQVRAFYRAYQSVASTPATGTISPALDTNTTGTTLVTSDGGTLDLFLNQGARITLTFPSNTVASPSFVTVTLVSNVVGLPFARGILEAVKIEPTNLTLFGAAMLEMTFPSNSVPDRRQVVGFAANVDGTGFYLAPDRVLTNSAMLPITGAGIYGSCLAATQELSQLATLLASPKIRRTGSAPAPRDAAPTVLPFDSYLAASVECFFDRVAAATEIDIELQLKLAAVLQNIAVFRAQERQNQPSSAVDDTPPTGLEIGAACAFYHSEIQPLFPQVQNNCSLLKVLALRALTLGRQLQLLGSSFCPELLSLADLPICDGAKACLNEIEQCCQQKPEDRPKFRDDLTSIVQQQEMMGVAGQSGCFGADSPEVEQALADCSDLEWNGSVTISESGEATETIQSHTRHHEIHVTYHGYVNSVTGGFGSYYLNCLGQLSSKDATATLTDNQCVEDCGDIHSNSESSASGTQAAQVSLQITGNVPNATYTLSVASGSPPLADVHQYSNGEEVLCSDNCKRSTVHSSYLYPNSAQMPGAYQIQGSLTDPNIVKGSTNFSIFWDPASPAQVTVGWDLHRTKPQ
jgi:hypothetical protein